MQQQVSDGNMCADGKWKVGDAKVSFIKKLKHKSLGW